MDDTEDECEVEEIFAQVPSIDLDPGQVNLLLSSLKPVNQTDDEVEKYQNVPRCLSSDSDGLSEFSPPGRSKSHQSGYSRKDDRNPVVSANTTILDFSPLSGPTPPPLGCSVSLQHCSNCDFFSLSREGLKKHESADHPPPRPTIQCISCPNVFLSLQSLKVHLLLDHEVLKSELTDILLLTLRKCEEFLLSTNTSGSNKKTNCKEINGSNECHDVIPVPEVIPESPRSLSDPKSLTIFSHQMSQTVNCSSEDTGTLCEGTDQFDKNTLIDLVSEMLPSETASSANDNVTLDNNRLQLDDANSTVKQVASTSVSQDSDCVTFDNEEEEEEEDDEDGLYTDDSDDDSYDDSLDISLIHQDSDESITKHLQLMEQIKKEKLKAPRCRLANCNVRFKSVNTMSYHKKCHNEDKKDWKCPECSRVFVAWHSLSLHLWNDHSIDMELYYCNFCSFRTPNLSHLRTSHIRIHGKGKMFTCTVCNKSFKTSKQLRNHQVVHKENKVRYECKSCKALFSRCHLLRQHYDAVHQRVKRFRCNTCGHRSASQSAHNLHVRKHTKEKKYACGECCYSTGDHNALRRHLATHSGVRPYSCPHCPYTSISSKSLLAHVSSKHPGMLGDVVFSCPLCPFKTLRKEIFVAHASKHNFVQSPAALKLTPG